MENPNDPHESDEEIQEEVVNNHAEDLDHDSDAFDYEWEREMQELWREFDEAYVEAYGEEEDLKSSLDEEFNEPVSVVRKLD